MADDLYFNEVVNATIDITRDVCPITYVRTRLALDRLLVGQILAIKLKGAEPAENVPRAALEQGHEILLIDPQSDGTTLVILRRGE